MRVKTLLISTAIVSAILGATMVYLVLTVPNDIKAGALLKGARKDVAAGRNDRARDELTRIVQQYPRTDAAAAAIAALTSMADHERRALQASLQVSLDAQKAQIADLQKKVAALAAIPPPVVAPAPPPPAPQPQPKPKRKPKPAPKKTPPKKRHRR